MNRSCAPQWRLHSVATAFTRWLISCRDNRRDKPTRIGGLGLRNDVRNCRYSMSLCDLAAARNEKELQFEVILQYDTGRRERLNSTNRQHLFTRRYEIYTTSSTQSTFHVSDSTTSTSGFVHIFILFLGNFISHTHINMLSKLASYEFRWNSMRFFFLIAITN